MSRRELKRELERLYSSRFEEFLRVALAILGDPVEARDAVQEGFARALKSLDGFTGSGSFEGWVWRIVVNAARALNRDRLPLAEVPEPEAAERGSVDEEVRRWVALLPERQRLAVFLRYYADLDYRAIAVALEVQPGTVSATLSQAHDSLRRQLQEVEQ